MIMLSIVVYTMRSYRDGTKPRSFVSNDSFATPVVFDPETDAAFLPPEGWTPVIETQGDTVVSPSKMDTVLRVAYIAKRGVEYSTERPIRVCSDGETIIVRFPADTNAPAGFRYRGPTWVATITLNASTLQVISAIEDPN